MKRLRPAAAFLAMVCMLGLGGSAQAAATEPSVGSLTAVWTIDTRGYDGFSKLIIQGEYAVFPVDFELRERPDLEFLYKLAKKGTVSVEGDGAFGGVPTVYRSGKPGEGGITLAIALPDHPVPSLVDGIVVRNKKTGDVEIFAAPRIGVVADGAGEETGCWGEFQPIRLADTEWRTVGEGLEKSFPNRVSMPEAPECRGTMTVKVTASIREVRAVHGPYAAVPRGSTVTLDGSRSTGGIRQWTWTLTPEKPDCGFGRTAELRGSRVDVVLLCDTRVALEVEGEKGRDRTETSVKVRPRAWATSFAGGGETKYSNRFPPLTKVQSSFGVNSCAIEGEEVETGHWIHHANDASWQGEGGGYQVARVRSGPFAGLHYISENMLRIARLPQANPDLAPGSLLDQANARRGRGKDFATLREQVKSHEQLHGTLVKLRLGAVDPAPRLEELVGESQSDVAEKADGIIRAAETELLQATRDEQVKARQRKDPRFACRRSGLVCLRKTQDARAAERGRDRTTLEGQPSLSDDDLLDFEIKCYAELGDESVP